MHLGVGASPLVDSQIGYGNIPFVASLSQPAILPRGTLVYYRFLLHVLAPKDGWSALRQQCSPKGRDALFREAWKDRLYPLYPSILEQEFLQGVSRPYNHGGEYE